MEEYAPKLSSFVMTPDPHYIPGFTGYCPRLKYNMGKPYGRLTHQFLSSPEATLSRHWVLTEGHDAPPEFDSALTLKMIPGYTGFIPKQQNYFASSYSETCRKALAEFYQERCAKIKQRSSDLPAVVNYSRQQFAKPGLPLMPISDKVFTYKPAKPFVPLVKPYLMDDDDPNKCFMSGFTGHVPKSRFLSGKGYPITTNQALIQFGAQQRNDSTSQRQDVSTTTIYPSDRGLIPSFTGHIPGYRFMYGQTFGQLSQNALENSGIRRLPEDKS